MFLITLVKVRTKSASSSLYLREGGGVSLRGRVEVVREDEHGTADEELGLAPILNLSQAVPFAEEVVRIISHGRVCRPQEQVSMRSTRARKRDRDAQRSFPLSSRRSSPLYTLSC